MLTYVRQGCERRPANPCRAPLLAPERRQRVHTTTTSGPGREEALIKPPHGRNGSRDDPLDEAFPLGDGRAQDEAGAHCPYCGAPVVLRLDPGSGARQDYVEDCPVCCRPWRVRLRYAPDGSADVTLTAEDET